MSSDYHYYVEGNGLTLLFVFEKGNINIGEFDNLINMNIFLNGNVTIWGHEFFLFK